MMTQNSLTGMVILVLWSEPIFRVKGLSLDPEDHPVKLYPSLAVALRVTLDSLAADLVIAPPSPAIAIRVYSLVTITSSVTIFSLVQLTRVTRANSSNNFS